MDKYLQLLQARAIEILKRDKWENNDIAKVLNITSDDVGYLSKRYYLFQARKDKEKNKATDFRLLEPPN